MEKQGQSVVAVVHPGSCLVVNQVEVKEVDHQLVIGSYVVVVVGVSGTWRVVLRFSMDTFPGLTIWRNGPGVTSNTAGFRR